MGDVSPRIGPVGVVGAGTMGAGIAQVALEAGHEVRLCDIDAASLERARARIFAGLARRIARGGVSESERIQAVADAMDRLAVVIDLDAVATGSVLIIEAAVEDLALKRQIFAELDRQAPGTAILATNTSALRVGEIAAATTHPERVVGLHFFNPAPVMRLVEVVAPPDADADVLGRAAALMSDWGKTPVRTADSPGFIVNRVNRPFTLEALRILEAGESDVAGIDAALRDAGFPMGPFELMDLIGIDVNLAAARGVWEGFDRDERFRPSPIQERLVAEGRLGRKTRAGFYEYDRDGKPTGPATLPGGSAPRGAPLEPAMIADRIIMAIVNEAFRALGERLASAQDIDLALRLGAGHPIGPFERTELQTGGRAAVARRLEQLAGAFGPRFAPAPALRSGG